MTLNDYFCQNIQYSTEHTVSQKHCAQLDPHFSVMNEPKVILATNVSFLDTIFD